MNSHWISKRQVRSAIIASIISLTILALGIYPIFFSDELSSDELWSVAFFTIFGLVLCIVCLYLILFTFRGGKYAIDNKGITMHIGRRRWYLTWGEIQECNMFALHNGGQTIWVYFSSRHLEEGEPLLFFRRKWDDLEKVAFFQYSKKELQQNLNKIPPHFSRNLRAKQEELDRYLKWSVKVRHH